MAPLNYLLFLSALSIAVCRTPSRSIVTAEDWNTLNQTVGGRLHTALPFSAPCFPEVNGKTSTVDNSTCALIQANYVSPSLRVESFGAFMLPQWEGCMSKSKQCLLDSSNPTDPAAWTEFSCSQGSVSEYHIEVEDYTHVQAAFNFSLQTGIPISIKNTGHDYLGRSSIKGSLSIWTHNITHISYNESFVPDGGQDFAESYPAITIGAGVYWREAYIFADANNITVVGGYHQTVGASGGWAMAGGHSVLSPVYGLGIDRVLEFKVVTPDGMFRVANAHSNTDLFWALRGGGGGTFGVVMETTFRVEPRLTLQVASLNITRTTPEFLRILVDNGLQWGQEGWGGHYFANSILSINPLLTLDQAKASMRNLSDYVSSQNGTIVIETLPSWLAFYNKYVYQAEAAIGVESVLASRLLSGSLFETESGRDTVYNALVELLPYGEGLEMLATTPFLYNYTEGTTSATPAWRGALWHTINGFGWKFNSTIDEKRAAFASASNTTAALTAIAPNSGAYMNEANVYEPNYEESFWGSNYPRLLSLKHQYDPHGLLDCWRCVGWKGANDSRYQCYL